jgi:hypothetical protein
MTKVLLLFEKLSTWKEKSFEVLASKNLVINEGLYSMYVCHSKCRDGFHCWQAVNVLTKCYLISCILVVRFERLWIFHLKVNHEIPSNISAETMSQCKSSHIPASPISKFNLASNITFTITSQTRQCQTASYNTRRFNLLSLFFHLLQTFTFSSFNSRFIEKISRRKMLIVFETVIHVVQINPFIKTSWKGIWIIQRMKA